MGSILEKHLEEFKDDELFKRISSEEKEKFLDSTKEISETIIKYFNIPEEVLFKETCKKKGTFPRQLCHFLISEKNKKFFGNKAYCPEYWSLTGKFFGFNHSTIIYSYQKIKEKKDLNGYEGERIREILNLFEDYADKLENSKSLIKLDHEKKTKFLNAIQDTSGRITKYFGMTQKCFFEGIEKIKKDKMPFQYELFFYELCVKNKKIFGNDYSSLMSNLFEVNSEEIFYSYYRINVLKDENNEDGKNIREALNFLRK
ncbi:MAG: hypothetical protein AABX80_01305 [Nanoarchaeota archaeon]